MKSKPQFRIAVAPLTAPRTSENDVRVSLAAERPPQSSPEAGLADLWIPSLAPSAELRNWYADDVEKWHEFCRRYGFELEERRTECEALRRRAHENMLVLTYWGGDAEHNVAAAMKQHLVRLECKHRWKNGWMVGGYTSAVREEIESLGGLWYPRHKVWMMPDESSLQYIRSILPGDF